MWCSVGANSSDHDIELDGGRRRGMECFPLARYLNSLLFGLSNVIAKAKPKSKVGEGCETSVWCNKTGLCANWSSFLDLEDLIEQKEYYFFLRAFFFMLPFSPPHGK